MTPSAAPLPDRLNVVMSRDKSRQADSRPGALLFTNQPPRKLLDRLTDLGYSEAVLAGGAMINELFAQANLIDEMYITVSPMIFGRGISLFNSEMDMSLTLLEVKRLGAQSVRLHYKVVR
jgi:dihydrofolate reductase